MKLNEEQKAFLIRCRAQFMRARDISDAFREAFGADIDRRQLFTYSLDFPKLAPKWRELHDRLREDFITKIDAIPIANRAFRLQELQRHYETMKDKRAVGVCQSILEQAAKESGDAFTNKREFKGKVDATVQQEMNPDQARALVAAALEDALRAGSNAST
jgi:hypothetical protein